MVGPEENHAVGRTIEGLDGLSKGLGEVKVGEVSESAAQLGGEVVARGRVIGVPEDANVGVQGLEGFPGVLDVTQVRRHPKRMGFAGRLAMVCTWESQVTAASTSL